jgi:hypothetical protein
MLREEVTTAADLARPARVRALAAVGTHRPRRPIFDPRTDRYDIAIFIATDRLCAGLKVALSRCGSDRTLNL